MLKACESFREIVSRVVTANARGNQAATSVKKLQHMQHSTLLCWRHARVPACMQPTLRSRIVTFRSS